jgi:hypothetical protein
MGQFDGPKSGPITLAEGETQIYGVQSEEGNESTCMEIVHEGFKKTVEENCVSTTKSFSR